MSTALAFETTPTWLREEDGPVAVTPDETVRVLENRERQLIRQIKHIELNIEGLMLRLEKANKELDETSDARLEAQDAIFAEQDGE